ncbi:MAG: serine hydrolase domain-containing protein [Pseudomonadota bacterium]
MRQFLRWVFRAFLALILLAGAAVAAFLYAPSGYEARLASVEWQAERGAARGHWPGVMWAVVTDGEVISTGAAGFANLEDATPMTPDTIMPIGSITKVLAGLAGSLAVEDEMLDLDAPVSDVLSVPFDPPLGQPVSFAHLATHTAGILDTDAGYEEVGYHYGDTRNPVSLDAFLARYLGAEGDLSAAENFGPWAPGEVYAYSNVGAGLAGQVIADATGTSYAEYTSARIANPLGLTGYWGHIGPSDDAGGPMATLYGRDEDGNHDALPPYGLATWPDGQFNASANDLARLMAVMMGDGVLEGAQVFPASVIARQKTPRASDIPGKETPGDFIGLFWERETLSLGPLSATFEGHSGGDPGVITFMYRVPGNPTGIVLMFNGEPDSLPGFLSMVRLLRTLSGMPLPEDPSG